MNVRMASAVPVSEVSLQQLLQLWTNILNLNINACLVVKWCKMRKIYNLARFINFHSFILGVKMGSSISKQSSVIPMCKNF